MRKKSLIIGLLLLISLFCLGGCGSPKQQSQASNDSLAQAVQDGFKLSDVAGSALSAEDQALWQSADSGELSGLTPVTVLAEHSSGIRLFLCRNMSRTGLDGWMTAAISAESGSVQKVDSFDVWIKTCSFYDTPVIPENKGWKIRVPEDEAALFTKEMYGIFQIAARHVRIETTFVPVDLLAQQLVAGTNYKYLCTDKAGEHLYILDIYEDMNSDAEINAVGYVDLDMYIGK